MTTTIPDLSLERYRLNELPEAEAQALTRRIAEDPALRARLEAIERSDAEIARQYPADAFLRRLRPLVAPKPHRVRMWAMAAGCAAAAGMIAIALPRDQAPAHNAGVVAASGVGTDRIKGAPAYPALSLYRRTAAGSERLADGGIARAGDLLRVGYASAGRAYGLILSIDGRGAVTVHLPPKGDRAAPLTAGGTILLDNSYELDDAPRVERFYFVTGPEPFAVAPVVDAARRAAQQLPEPAALALPKGLDQVTFSIQKEGRP